VALAGTRSHRRHRHARNGDGDTDAAEDNTLEIGQGGPSLMLG
jgi:hypothetical protein